MKVFYADRNCSYRVICIIFYQCIIKFTLNMANEILLDDILERVTHIRNIGEIFSY